MALSIKQECSLCQDTGWRPVERAGSRAVEVCTCRQQLYERGADQRARIPKRYRQCVFESFDISFALDESRLSLDNALMKAKGFVKEYPLVEKGLFFLGNPGVGKTHLTVAILKGLMAQKKADCLFCSFQELLQQIRDSYNPVSLSTESGVLRPVLETEVVAIDDLGANRVSDWVEDTVTYILNYRYNQKKLTLLTSNLPDEPAAAMRNAAGRDRVPDTLTDRVGVRVRSRLYEMCEVVQITAKDHREQVLSHRR